jgi:ribosomal protein S20
MPIASILSAVAILAALMAGVEGINVATDGQVYLASLQTLAQMEAAQPKPAEQPMPPAPSAEPASAADDSSLGTQPPMPPKEGGYQPQPMPPQPMQRPQFQQGEIPPGQEGQMRPFDREQRMPPEPMPPQPFQQFQPFQQRRMPNEQKGQMQRPPEPMPPQFEFESEQGPEPQEFELPERQISPQEIKQTLRDIKMLMSNLKRIVSKLRKVTSDGDVSRAEEIMNILSNFQNVISSGNNEEIIDALDEFRQENYWEEVNRLRLKTELPREIKQMASAIKRLQKMLNVKALQKLGLNLGAVRQNVVEMNETLQSAQSFYQNGEFDEAMETLQELRENINPDEIQNVLNRLNNFNRMISRARNKDAKAQARQILQQAIDAFNSGEYHEAQEILNSAERTLQSLMGAPKSRR